MTDVFINNVNKLWDVSCNGTVWLSVFSESSINQSNMLVCPIHDLAMFMKAPTHKYNLIVPQRVWQQIVKNNLITSPPKLFKLELEVQTALGILDDHTFNGVHESVWEVNIDKMLKCLEKYKNKEKETNEVR